MNFAAVALGSVADSYYSFVDHPDIVAAGGWTHATFLADPKWAANPGNGNAIPSVRDQGGTDPVQATAGNRPTFRSAVAQFNGMPAAEFDGVNDSLFVDFADIIQPFQVVLVIRQLSEPAANRYFVGTGGGATDGFYRRNTSDQWSAYFGGAGEMVASVGGTADLNPHVLAWLVNGVTSTFSIDGTTTATNAGATVPGTHGFTSWTLGAAVGGASGGNIQIAACGIKADATTSMAKLITATKGVYGVP